MTHREGSPRVVVVGGGLAGISAAIGLADAGLDVTLLEARAWLGGATCSFGRRGLTIDNGQHVFLRCYTAYRDLIARLGVSELCHLQDRLELTVLGPQGACRVRRSGLPAPFHLARALMTYRLLPAADRVKLAAAVLALQFTDADHDDRTLGDWLARYGQHERARRAVWDLLSLSALNLTADRAELPLAAGAISTALLAGRGNADLGIPLVPLNQIHGAPAARLLRELNVTVRLGVRAVAVRRDEAAGGFTVRLAHSAPSDVAVIGGTESASGREQVYSSGPAELHAAGVILAVPGFEAADLVPAEVTAAAAIWSSLRPSPVISVHVCYGSQVMRLPFALAAAAPVDWIIDKTASAGLRSGQYLAASVRAADAYVDMPIATLRAELLPVLERIFPAAGHTIVTDFFVTKERRATMAHVPGSQRARMAGAAELPGFAVAGAWTDTGWPDTMEGAVRSGQKAAAKLIADLPAQATRVPAPRSAGESLRTSPS